MKKHARRTKIADISGQGLMLSDEGLRLVAGGLRREPTTPASITEPGKTDTATDS